MYTNQLLKLSNQNSKVVSPVFLYSVPLLASSCGEMLSSSVLSVASGGFGASSPLTLCPAIPGKESEGMHINPSFSFSSKERGITNALF